METAGIRFDRDGLIPCIAQDRSSGEVLMLAWANAEAIGLTVSTGELHFFSRSRQEIWRKGGTSGNVLKVSALRLDCDRDSLLALVEPAGPACHTGQRTCFHEADLEALQPFEVLPGLERVIESRAGERPEGSYTVELLTDPALAGAKVEEEAEEVSRAAREESDGRVAEEAADLIYHLLVLMRGRGLSLADAEAVLAERRGA